jgi:hypothetical protein
VQRGARFCGKLSDFRFDQDAFVGLRQASGNAAVRRSWQSRQPLPSLSGQLSMNWLLIVPVLRQDAPIAVTAPQAASPPTCLQPMLLVSSGTEPAEAAGLSQLKPQRPGRASSTAAAGRKVLCIGMPRSRCRHDAAIGQAQPQERLFAGDALVGILPHLQAAELTNLTRTVARLDLVSGQLRSFLVRHPDNDISCRMLKDATHLSDVDILSLVPGANEQQLRLIARRRMLTTSVCDAIIGNGNRNAILDLLRNSEAELSPGAFTRLLDTSCRRPGRADLGVLQQGGPAPVGGYQVVLAGQRQFAPLYAEPVPDRICCRFRGCLISVFRQGQFPRLAVR